MTTPFRPSELTIFIQWILRREAIRKAKEAGGPKPWTADPLLRGHRWCNVRRMDDRVSRWLLENWYGDRDDINAQIVDAAYARLINWPDALAEIADARLPDDARITLQERATRGDKVFTGAYVIPGVPGKNKVDSVCDLVQRILDDSHDLAEKAISMKRTWELLCEYDGVGSFLAGQMVADLAERFGAEDWPDARTWAPVGPGSARGLNRLLGQPKDRIVSQAEFDRALPAVIAQVQHHLPSIWSDRGLVAMDVQNCLCEFDKYRRLQLGEGKVRARYDGAGNAQGTLL